MVREFTHGLMVVNMKVNGATTKCMAGAPLFGKMAGSMSVSILMIRNKAMVSSFGLTVGNI